MHGVSSIMLCGWFAASGSGTLQKVDGIMEKQNYLKILQLNCKTVETWIRVFQEDTDRTLKLVLLKKADIELPKQPSQHPNLNLIENLWIMIQSQAYAGKVTILNERSVAQRVLGFKRPGV